MCWYWAQYILKQICELTFLVKQNKQYSWQSQGTNFQYCTLIVCPPFMTCNSKRICHLIFVHLCMFPGLSILKGKLFRCHELSGFNWSSNVLHSIFLCKTLRYYMALSQFDMALIMNKSCNFSLLFFIFYITIYVNTYINWFILQRQNA